MGNMNEIDGKVSGPIGKSVRRREDQRFLTGVANYKEGSGRGRLIQWGNTLAMAAHHPLLGVGPGNWPVFYPKYRSTGDPSFDRDDIIPTNPWPSSDWMAMASERGFAALGDVLTGRRLRGIANLHRRSGEQVVNCRVSPCGRQNDKRVPAEQALDDDAGAGLKKAYVAAIAVVHDAQIGEIVPESAAGERDKNRFVQKQCNHHQDSERARKPVVLYRDCHQHPAEKDRHGDYPVEHDPAKTARKPRVARPRRRHIGVNTHCGIPDFDAGLHLTRP